jgi:hypothetical protein
VLSLGVYRELSKLLGGWDPWNFMTFHSVGKNPNPIDELLIFFKMVVASPTRIPIIVP